MNLKDKKILFNKNKGYDHINFRQNKFKIILIDEEIFIKIVSIKNKNNIDKVIKDVVNNTFYNYNVLVHYNFINVLNKIYLIVYFIRYHEKLREIVEQSKEINIIPLQFAKPVIYNFYFNKKYIDIEIKKFEEVIYLIIRIKGIVIYTKNYYENISNNDIKESLEIINSSIDIKDFKLRAFINNDLYYEDLKNLFNKIKLMPKEVI